MGLMRNNRTMYISNFLTSTLLLANEQEEVQKMIENPFRTYRSSKDFKASEQKAKAALKAIKARKLRKKKQNHKKRFK